MLDGAVERLVDERVAVCGTPQIGTRVLATEPLQRYLLTVPDLTDPARPARDDVARAARQARAAFTGKLPSRRRRREYGGGTEARLRRETDPVVRADRRPARRARRSRS